jgi:hypothetical protein
VHHERIPAARSRLIHFTRGVARSQAAKVSAGRSGSRSIGRWRLKYNEQCPIGKTATKREVIDAKNRRYRKRLCHLGLGQPQERIRAHLRASCFEQPCSRLSSTLNGKDVQEKRQSFGSPGNGSNEIRQRWSRMVVSSTVRPDSEIVAHEAVIGLPDHSLVHLAVSADNNCELAVRLPDKLGTLPAQTGRWHR